MKPRTWVVLLWLGTARLGSGQETGSRLATYESEEPTEAVATYTVQGATPEQERLLRTQIQIMEPAVLPRRIMFVPHWHYLYAAKIYRLHVPNGMSSKMFTHLASRSVYIDADLCGGEDWLGHWMAHELGHLATNSAREEDAERAARGYRKRLKDARERPVPRSSNQLLGGASTSAR